MEQEKYQEENLQEVEVMDVNGCKLVLHNDDYHTSMQAEQCALLVHHRGKCVIKTGSYEKLMPMHTALLDRQLTSEIVQ